MGEGYWAAVIGSYDHEVSATSSRFGVERRRRSEPSKQHCLARVGTPRQIEAPVLRSDNGLIFQRRWFRQACRDYSLQQEFITLYRPKRNRMIEGFFRSLKQEYVWQHTFQNLEEARQIIRRSVGWSKQDACSRRAPQTTLTHAIHVSPG